MRYFEYIDEKSNKFWEIHNHWNADKTYIEVRFGKIGSEGRITKHVYYGVDAGEKLESNLIKVLFMAISNTVLERNLMHTGLIH